mgnify:CR=1 FL=1
MNNFRILQDILNLRDNNRFAIIIRHAEREKQQELFPDNETHLTKQGIETSKMLGQKLLPFQSFRFFSSPAARCRETAKAIMLGRNLDYPLEESCMLGKHGPFVINSSRTGEEMKKLGKDFIKAWFSKELEESIILPPNKGTDAFLEWILPKMEEVSNGLDIYISHDLIITPIIASLLPYDILKEGLVNFLDGFILCKKESGVYEIIFRGLRKTIYRSA